eukprot:394856_1
MGNLLNNIYTSSGSSDENYRKAQTEIIRNGYPIINVQSQMIYIIHHWTRHCNIYSFPHDIRNLIVNIYAFQQIFDTFQQSKQQYPYTQPHPRAPHLEYDYLFKVTLIGASGVGKRALLTRFCDDYFSDASFFCDKSVDFKVKNMYRNDDTKPMIKILIWDGTELHYMPFLDDKQTISRISRYFRRVTHGILFVYDTTNKDSFEAIKKLYHQIETNKAQNLCKMLIGTKCDLIDKKAVNVNDVEQLAQELNISNWIETSAKTAENVNEAFDLFTKEMIQRQNRPFYG